MTETEAFRVTSDDAFQARMAMLRPGGDYRITLAHGTYGAVKTVIPPCRLVLRGEKGATIDGYHGQDALLAHGEAHVRIVSLRIIGGWRSCVAFGSDPTRQGALILDECEIIGASDGGNRSKWGAITHGQEVYVTRTTFSKFLEHGVYAHNAPIVACIRIRSSECGRTAVQSVARLHENGGGATERVIIETATLTDIGDLDGGGAITVQGAGWVELRRVMVHAGNNGSALVVWPEHDPASGKQGRRIGLVLAKECELRSHGRPAMIISGVDCLAVADTVIERDPHHAVAVEIDDPSGGTAGKLFPTKQFIRGPGVSVRGKVTIGGAG